MFTVLACADLQGGKVNLELTFQALPNIGELSRRVEEVFSTEVRSAGGADAGYDFRVNRLQIYDDVLLKWVDLVSSTQLHEYDQIYVFQPQTHWHVDTQQDLPPPRPPQQAGPAVAVHHAPQIEHHHHHHHHQQHSTVAAHPGGERPNIPAHDKTQVVFRELDLHNRGFIEYTEFERSLRERGLDFSSNTTGELFYKADLNRDGKVTFDEWSNWCQIYPNTLETLYFRTKDTSEEAQLRVQIQQAHDRMAANKAQIEALARQMEQNQNNTLTLQAQVGPLQQQAIAASQKRQTLTVDERELLEEEIRMERQRDQMRLQQARFKEVSEKFNRESAVKVCPFIFFQKKKKM